MSHCGAWCFCIDSREVQEQSIGYALLLIPPQLFIMALITRYAGESIRFNALSFRRVPSRCSRAERSAKKFSTERWERCQTGSWRPQRRADPPLEGELLTGGVELWLGGTTRYV
jgi:hypothetical protein